MAKQINKYAPYAILAYGVFVYHLPLVPSLVLAGILGVVSAVVDIVQEEK